jgi:hypothetical protein
MTWGILTVSLLLAGGLLAVGVPRWRAEQREDETAAQLIGQEMVEAILAMPVEAIKARAIGLTAPQLKERLGEPESTWQLPSNDGPLEMYYYPCKEGRLKVKLLNGKAIDAAVD